MKILDFAHPERGEGQRAGSERGELVAEEIEGWKREDPGVHGDSEGGR